MVLFGHRSAPWTQHILSLNLELDVQTVNISHYVFTAFAVTPLSPAAAQTKIAFLHVRSVDYLLQEQQKNLWLIARVLALCVPTVW